jgi:hypothetical protein
LVTGLRLAYSGVALGAQKIAMQQASPAFEGGQDILANLMGPGFGQQWIVTNGDTGLIGNHVNTNIWDRIQQTKAFHHMGQDAYFLPPFIIPAEEQVFLRVVNQCPVPVDTNNRFFYHVHL